MAYDAFDNYLVLFGGNAPYGTAGVNKTWTFANGTWSQLYVGHSPPATGHATLTYDVRDKYVVAHVGGCGWLETTWEFQAGAWKRSRSNAEPGVCDEGLTYDANLRKVLLYGGYYSGSNRFTNATWTYAGGQWKNITASSGTAPPPRANLMLAFDNSTGSAVLYGGQRTNGTYLSDTWNLSSTGWKLVPSHVNPGCRAYSPITWDPALGGLLLFGGWHVGAAKCLRPYGGAPTADTWAWKSGVWIKLQIPTAPSPRYAPAMVFDPAVNASLLFGGATKTQEFNDTWVHYLGAWTQLRPAASPTPRSGSSMLYDPLTAAVVLFGGTGSLGLLNDTWAFSNGTWTRLPTATSPPPLEYATMAYDRFDREIVLFGGNDGGFSAQTWTYRSGSWTNLTGTTGHTPSSRYGAASISDPATAGMLMFGGFNGAYLADTWLFKAGNWTLQSPLRAPSGRLGAGFSVDPARSGAVLFGGYNGSFLADTWTYSNGTWTPLTPGVSPPGREWAGMDYEPGNRQVYLFGGYGGYLPTSGWHF